MDSTNKTSTIDIYGRFHQALFEQSANLVIYLSAKAEIITANAKAEQIFSLSKQQLTGKKITALLSAQLLNEFFEQSGEHAGNELLNCQCKTNNPSIVNNYLINLTCHRLAETATEGYLITSTAISLLNNDSAPFPYQQQDPAFTLRNELEKLEMLSKKIMGHSSGRQQTINQYVQNFRRYYENIIACMPGNVFWTDDKKRLLGCNDNVMHMLGLNTREEIIGKTYEDYSKHNKLSPGQLKKFQETDNQVLKDGIASLNVEDPPLVDSHGNMIHFLTSRVPLRSIEDQTIGVVGISIDITEQKQTEKALTLSKERAEVASTAKSEFIASMSHDLRTPLNAVIGLAEILEDKIIDAEQKVLVQDIAQAGNTLLELIDDILNFSKIEAGKVKIKHESFSLTKLIKEIVEMVSHQAKQKGVDVVTSFCDSLPSKVIGDPYRVKRILLNLISNAVKFTDNGYVLISIEIIEKKDGFIKLQLAIEDTGIGIPTDKLDYIFERFNRLNPSYKGQYKGTGLGLTIVKQLIENLNATINVNSQYGKGSTFWCSIPFALEKQLSNESSWKENYQDVRILIVDDQAKKNKKLLQAINSTSNQIVNSDTALQELTAAHQQKKPYRIVIIDSAITQCQPQQLAGEIRKKAEFSDILISALCKKKELPQLQQEKNVFFTHFVKPLNTDKFLIELTQKWQEWLSSQIDQTKLLQRLKPKVLLVEDDKLSQKVIITFLTSVGCQVDTAETGKQALEKMDDCYDFILMDIGLPDTDGFAVTQKIKSSNAPSAKIPIIALTAHVSNVEREKCRQVGMCAFLTKPVKKDEIVKTIIFVLSNRHLDIPLPAS